MQNFDPTPLANASQDFAHRSFNHFVASANQLAELSRTFLQESTQNAAKAFAPVASADAFASASTAAMKEQAGAVLRFASASTKLAVEHAQRHAKDVQELADHGAAHWKDSFPESARIVDAFKPVMKAASSANEYAAKTALRMASDWERVAQSA